MSAPSAFSRMMKPCLILASGAAFSLLASSPALAQVNVGDRLVAMLSNVWGPLFFLIAGASYVVGIVVFIAGLNKLRESSNSSMMADRASLSNGLVKLFAAAMLIGLPEAAGIGVTTWTGTSANIFGSSSDLNSISRSLDFGQNGGPGDLSGRQGNLTSILGIAGSPAVPQDCYSASDPAVCMARNIAQNAVPIAIMVIFGMVFLVGLGMFFRSLVELARGDQGRGGVVPQGWGAKFAGSILMMNSPFLFGMISATILGAAGTGVIDMNGFDSSSSFLSYSYNGGSPTSVLAKFEELIGYILTILAFFGVWAFIRGLFIVKATAEGKTQNSYGNGAVFMAAGILLANSKISTCAILATLVGAGTGTMGFCS